MNIIHGNISSYKWYKHISRYKKYQHGCRDGYEHISRWLKIYVNIVVPESPPLFPCSGVGRHVGVLAFL